MKNNKNNNHDYSLFFMFLIIWTMLGCMAQCESTNKLYDINREVNNIRHELSTLRYNR